MAVYPVLPSYDQYCFELGFTLAELDLSTWDDDDQNATTSDSSAAAPPPPTSSSDSVLAVVSNMPTVAMDDTVCIVCMEGPHDHQADHDETDHHHQEVVGKQMPCNHVYHANCISTWLSRYNSCPLCRFTIDTTIATTSLPPAPSPPVHHHRQPSVLINS